MVAATTVPLETYSELETLRKQVAILEKSHTQEKDRAAKLIKEVESLSVRDRERQLSHIREKYRADKLNVELESLKLQTRQLKKSNQRKPFKINGPKTADEDVTLAREVDKQPHRAKKSKLQPKVIRVHSQSETSGALPVKSQNLAPSSVQWTDEDEKKLSVDLKARGVVFDSDADIEESTEIPVPTPKKSRRSSFWCRPISATDLFEIAPHYKKETMLFDAEAKKREIEARPSRKKTFGRVLAYSRKDRGLNPHDEVDRRLPSRLVRVRIAGSPEADAYHEGEDDYPGFTATVASAARPIKEVMMTFESFLGVPQYPLICKTTYEQLAYRDGTLDARGKLPRVTDEEKFEVGNKGGGRGD